jgi:hypothetical protein
VHVFYWDASVLVKRYAPEVGTPLLNAFFSHVSLDRMMCLSSRLFMIRDLTPEPVLS